MKQLFITLAATVLWMGGPVVCLTSFAQTEEPAAPGSESEEPVEALEEVTVTSSVDYACKGRKGFSADYLSDDTVRATFGSREFVLPRVPAASGARYSDGSVTIHTKGDEAFVEVGNRVLFEDCAVAGARTVQGLW